MVRYILLLFIGLAFWSCEDNAVDQDNPQPSLPTGTPIIEGKRVYISGFYQDSSLAQMVACFWVDGASPRKPGWKAWCTQRLKAKVGNLRVWK